MGHPDLRSECDINQLEPLLHQDVVDDLLSKYVKTFTVNIKQTHIITEGSGGCVHSVLKNFMSVFCFNHRI